MKATIENPVIYLPNSGDNFENVKAEYFYILQVCTTSINEVRLRVQMNNLFGMQYFKYGFESNHMWVKQVMGGETLKPRLIFVEF